MPKNLAVRFEVEHAFAEQIQRMNLVICSKRAEATIVMADIADGLGRLTRPPKQSTDKGNLFYLCS